MQRMVNCAKLGAELPGLEYAPMKGELGRRIYDTISREAWEMWMRQSTLLINEYRLRPFDPAAQQLLREHLEAFLFGEGSPPPPDLIPPP